MNNWMLLRKRPGILTACGLVAFAVVTLSLANQALARGYVVGSEEALDASLFDPFSLTTVSPFQSTTIRSVSPSRLTVASTSTVSEDSFASTSTASEEATFSAPTVRIPYRPTLRSPSRPVLR